MQFESKQKVKNINKQPLRSNDIQKKLKFYPKKKKMYKWIFYLYISQCIVTCSSWS